MKLNGIESSKGRREVFERNNARRAPEQSQPMMAEHTPTPHADGSLACSRCGTTRYSPLAFAAHLAGKPINDAEGMVFTLGPSDPWIAQQQPERQRQVAEDQAAERRQSLIDQYFEEQRRARPRIVEGVGSSMTD